jgi:hypothetical protein
MTLNVNFVETMQISRQRYAREVGASSGGRQSRAEEGTKLGALARVTDEQIAALAAESGSTTGSGNHPTEDNN